MGLTDVEGQPYSLAELDLNGSKGRGSTRQSSKSLSVSVLFCINTVAENNHLLLSLTVLWVGLLGCVMLSRSCSQIVARAGVTPRLIGLIVQKAFVIQAAGCLQTPRHVLSPQRSGLDFSQGRLGHQKQGAETSRTLNIRHSITSILFRYSKLPQTAPDCEGGPRHAGGKEWMQPPFRPATARQGARIVWNQREPLCPDC